MFIDIYFYEDFGRLSTSYSVNYSIRYFTMVLFLVMIVFLAYYYLRIERNQTLTLYYHRKQVFRFFMISTFWLFINGFISDDLVKKNFFGTVALGFPLILISLSIIGLAFFIRYQSMILSISKGYKFISKIIWNLNPIEVFRYKSSLNSLKQGKKSEILIKKFIILNKDILKANLSDSTPLNLREKVLITFNNDYIRIYKLLLINNISIRSRKALLDVLMDTLSPFVINFEVALKEFFTEEILKRDDFSSIKPPPDFINSKFSKFFAQWESLTISLNE